ncbi:MAG: hypothetical protein KDK36_13225, partial [Leptospiraceae bacterium]|nr:hypothetical protein [Leptospiraceae bacterium]
FNGWKKMTLTEITEKICNFAERSGLVITEILDEYVTKLEYKTDYGVEPIIVIAVGTNPDNNTVITIGSRGIELSSNMELNFMMSYHLMGLNSDMTLGNWRIETYGGRQFFNIAVPQVAETISLDDFINSVAAVLKARAKYRETFGDKTLA